MSTEQPITEAGKAWYKVNEQLGLNQCLPLHECLEHLSFNEQGLIPVIAQCHESQRVLMMAWMNKAALEETLKTGKMCYWSRSRAALWRKGESSGHTQRLVSLYIDCDGDTILAKVAQTGAACHTQRPDCFFWRLEPDNGLVRVTSASAKSPVD